MPISKSLPIRNASLRPGPKRALLVAKGCASPCPRRSCVVIGHTGCPPSPRSREPPICLPAARSATACKRTRAVARGGGAATAPDRPVAAAWDELRRSRLGRSGSTARLPQIVHPGRARRARAGACSVYQSDSAALLAASATQTVGKHLRDCGAGAGVAPEFMPKRHSAVVGRAAGWSTTRPCPEIDETRDAIHPRGGALHSSSRGYAGAPSVASVIRDRQRHR
jgi:hypothetical protein